MAPNDWEAGGWEEDADVDESDAGSEDPFGSDGDDEEVVASEAPGGPSDIPDFEAPDEIGDGDDASGDDEFSVASDLGDSPGTTSPNSGGEIPDFGESAGNSNSEDIPGVGGVDGSTEASGTGGARGAEGSVDVADFERPTREPGPETKSATTEAATKRAPPGFGDESESVGPVSDVGTDGTLAEGTDGEPAVGFGGDLADPAFEGDAPTIFSSTGVGLAAFIGGPLAAVVLLAYNCRSVGWEERMSSVLGVGLLGSAAIFGLVVLLPGLLLPVAGGYIGGSIYYAKQLESEIRTRIEEPLQTYSDAGALGIGCLFSVLMFFLVCAGAIVAA